MLIGLMCAGEQVGYSVRFEESFSKQTKIMYVTDGMLVQEAIRDPDLKKYKVHLGMLLCKSRWIKSFMA